MTWIGVLGGGLVAVLGLATGFVVIHGARLDRIRSAGPELTPVVTTPSGWKHLTGIPGVRARWNTNPPSPSPADEGGDQVHGVATVRLMRDGAPLADCDVAWRPSRAAPIFAQSRTSSTGEVTAPCDPGQALSFEVTTPQGRYAGVAHTSAKSPSVWEIATGTLRCHLPDGGSAVTVRLVATRRRSPLRGGRFEPDVDLERRPVLIRGVPEGTYELGFVVDGVWHAESGIIVRVGQITDVRPRESGCVLEVPIPSDLLPRGADIRLLSPETVTGAIRDGTVRFALQRPSADVAVLAVRAGAGPSLHLTADLERVDRRTMRGRIRNPSGAGPLWTSTLAPMSGTASGTWSRARLWIDSARADHALVRMSDGGRISLPSAARLGWTWASEVPWRVCCEARTRELRGGAVRIPVHAHAPSVVGRIHRGDRPLRCCVRLSGPGGSGGVAVTDPDGRFWFCGLPAGDVELQFQDAGTFEVRVRTDLARTRSGLLELDVDLATSSRVHVGLPASVAGGHVEVAAICQSTGEGLDVAMTRRVRIPAARQIEVAVVAGMRNWIRIETEDGHRYQVGVDAEHLEAGGLIEIDEENAYRNR